MRHPALVARRLRAPVLLAYHGLGPRMTADDPSRLWVEPVRFRRQVEALLRAGFELVTVSELSDRWGDRPKPPRGLACLTFDDGMHDNHAVLLPILRELGVPATVYVATGLVGGPNPFMAPGSGQRMMSEDELRDLVAAGVELGAHTITHPDLEQLDEAACLAEIAGSREWLEQRLGVRVRSFAYPYCHFGPEAVRAVARAGLDTAVTCHGRGGWRRHELRRTMVTGRDGPGAFTAKVLGAYDPAFTSPPGRLVRAATRPLRRRLDPS